MTRYLRCLLLVLPFWLGGTPVQARDTYFPPSVWGPSSGAWTVEERAQFYERWFGDQLAAMREKPLWIERRKDGAATSIRLLFLPSFDNGTMVRLSILPDGQMKYVFKRLDGAGGYEPGRLVEQTQGTVDSASATKIHTLLSEVDPLGRTTPSQVFDLTRVCMDGTETILEATGGGVYNAIIRHECELAGPDPIRKLIHILNEISEGGLIAPMTFVERP